MTVFPCLAVFHRNLSRSGRKTLQDFKRRIHDSVILQRIFRNVPASSAAVITVRAWSLHIIVKIFRICMIISAFQTVIRQINRINRMRRLQERLRIITIFNNRLLQLLIITVQTRFLNRRVLILSLKWLKSKNKMMQSAVLGPVTGQYRHSSPSNIFVSFILIQQFNFLVFLQMFCQICSLKFHPHCLTVLICPQFLNDLLNRTGIAAIFRKKKARTCSQHIILIQKRVTVNTVRKLISLLRDFFKDADIHPLFLSRLFHLCTVLVDVHIFVGKAEQLPHRASLKITGKRIARRIADRYLRMLSGILSGLLTDLLKAFAHTCMIQPLQNSNKFITAVTSCKKFIRNCLSELYCKGADVFITFVMTERIVDRPEIIHIKYAHGNQFFLRDRIWIIEDFLTFVFVRKPGCLVEVDFFL